MRDSDVCGERTKRHTSQNQDDLHRDREYLNRSELPNEPKSTLRMAPVDRFYEGYQRTNGQPKSDKPLKLLPLKLTSPGGTVRDGR